MSKNIFNSVALPKVGSNTFDLSHDVKMSFKMGGIYPTLVLDCIPGDRFKMSSETMLRFAPMLAPVMHRVNITTHFFFVPNRILWPNWEKWITGDLEVEPPYLTPPVDPDALSNYGYFQGTIADYFGLPTIEGDGPASDTIGQNTRISAFPLAAYLKVWDEYYRDQNLQQEHFSPLVDGNCNGVMSWGTNYRDRLGSTVLERAWQHDYFTSALPFAQKGDAVQIPIAGFNDVNVILSNNPGRPILRDDLGPTYGELGPMFRTTGGALGIEATPPVPNPGGVRFDPNGTLLAKTSDLNAEAADINSLRRAFRLQEWLERNARGGTRYIENILAHFGVKSSDARLQRPEYLGGSRQNMVISEVLSTAETGAPIGQMAGHGIAVGSGKDFTYYCEEHGWIIGLINVQPTTAYSQGIARMWTREDRLDYFWPSFAHIGEQEVKNKELCVIGDTGYDEATFGYVPRYAEYRYMNNRFSGEFRSTLSFWHLGRIFNRALPPQLNDTFIKANPNTRIFAVEEGDHIFGHIYNRIRAVRKMPKYGIPSF